MFCASFIPLRLSLNFEKEFDTFIEIKPKKQQPSIPGDLFVECGFFFQVHVYLVPLYAYQHSDLQVIFLISNLYT